MVESVFNYTMWSIKLNKKMKMWIAQNVTLGMTKSVGFRLANRAKFGFLTFPFCVCQFIRLIIAHTANNTACNAGSGRRSSKSGCRVLPTYGVVTIFCFLKFIFKNYLSIRIYNTINPRYKAWVVLNIYASLETREKERSNYSEVCKVQCFPLLL